jgi:serine/threonine protein kinase
VPQSQDLKEETKKPRDAKKQLQNKKITKPRSNSIEHKS